MIWQQNLSRYITIRYLWRVKRPKTRLIFHPEWSQNPSPPNLRKGTSAPRPSKQGQPRMPSNWQVKFLLRLRGKALQGNIKQKLIYLSGFPKGQAWLHRGWCPTYPFYRKNTSEWEWPPWLTGQHQEDQSHCKVPFSHWRSGLYPRLCKD